MMAKAGELTKRQYQLLRGPSKAYAALLDEWVTKRRDAALHEMIEACEVLTETNCWYVTYDLGPTLSVLCKKELAQRQWRREAKKRRRSKP
jgi:hypothetical protein